MHTFKASPPVIHESVWFSQAKSVCTCMREPSSGFEHSLCRPAPDKLMERPRLPDQSFKSIYKCTKPDADRMAHGHSV